MNVESSENLLQRWNAGDTHARDRVVTEMYDELRRLAGRVCGRRLLGATLQPTALLHELHLRLAALESVAWRDRAHFVGAMVRMMRNIVVDHERQRMAHKRGGDWQRVPLHTDQYATDTTPEVPQLLELDRALALLATLDPRCAELVELRAFAGFTNTECADLLGIGLRTVEREWARAKRWLGTYFDGFEGVGRTPE